MDEIGGTSHHRARSATWSISTHDERLRSFLDEILADLVAPLAAGSAHFDLRRSTPDAVDQLIGAINRSVSETATSTIDLHASALTDPTGEFTVVTTGASGQGKTTIAAHLCRAGWSYLSDETVGVEIGDGSLVGEGKPLTIKEGLHTTLMALGLDLAPLTLDPDLQKRWYVRPSLLGGSVVSTAPPPTDLVFSQFDPGVAETRIQPLAPQQALLQLLSNTYQLDRHGPRVLPVLARLVATARCWELRFADGAHAVDRLVAVAKTTPRPNHLIVQPPAADDSTDRTELAPTQSAVFVGFDGVGGVVHDHVRSTALALDPIAMMVWRLLDGKTSITELTHDLASHFEQPVSTIATDVQGLCDDLVERGFLIV